ncbi:hypothetical protein Ctob_011816 [Chrysochromulina tobinii]|uniref:Uncharacterized protein n=1 Tax=Chrysochromulina tobinii TaxID=1460289 RepID=A0A0M0JIQ9_9EUKA|nr:hypothetical protein Ctob_011816 [Chrysochromulina tobinii]|eukprot:KOO26466.1 hypothetical protein Ctob_011816 [Chrysochromulina sp. CCMP291]
MKAMAAEKLEAMAAEHLEAMEAMAAGFEAKLAQARASAGAGLPEQLAAQLAARVQEIEAERAAPGPLCALVQAASEVLSPRVGAVLSEALHSAQQRQLIELTAATSEGKDSKVLDDAVTVAWNHLWALSLSPAEGREHALAAMQAEHEAARARVGQHVGQEAELGRRKSARERAEEEDGFSGFRRSLRELIALHDRLAHEEATNAALRRDLEAACLATDAAERRFSEQEHSLVQLRTAVVRLTELSAALDLELRQQKQACAELEQSLARAAHELRLEKEHAEAAAERHAESVAELEARLTGGRGGRSRRFGSAEHVSAPPSAADFELQVHERAQLETLREEVERQKAMRLAAATGGPDAGLAEARLEALRAELAGAEAAHEAVVAELTAAF